MRKGLLPYVVFLEGGWVCLSRVWGDEPGQTLPISTTAALVAGRLQLLPRVPSTVHAAATAGGSTLEYSDFGMLPK